MAALEAGRRSSTFRFQKGDCRQPRSPRPAHSSPVNIKETFCNRSDLIIGASRAPFPTQNLLEGEHVAKTRG